MSVTGTFVDVRLTWAELRAAAYLGIDRYVRNSANGRHNSYGLDTEAWREHVLGAWGECVVAKVTDTYWLGGDARPDGGAADVGRLHVRTRGRADYDLLLWDDDADAEPFVLVVPMRLPCFRVIGWCLAGDGKRSEYRRTDLRHPAYFVPQSVLRPISELEL